MYFTYAQGCFGFGTGCLFGGEGSLQVVLGEAAFGDLTFQRSRLLLQLRNGA